MGSRSGASRIDSILDLRPKDIFLLAVDADRSLLMDKLTELAASDPRGNRTRLEISRMLSLPTPAIRVDFVAFVPFDERSLRACLRSPVTYIHRRGLNLEKMHHLVTNMARPGQRIRFTAQNSMSI